MGRLISYPRLLARKSRLRERDDDDERPRGRCKSRRVGRDETAGITHIYGYISQYSPPFFSPALCVSLCKTKQKIYIYIYKKDALIHHVMLCEKRAAAARRRWRQRHVCVSARRTPNFDRSFFFVYFFFLLLFFLMEEVHLHIFCVYVCVCFIGRRALLLLSLSLFAPRRVRACDEGEKRRRRGGTKRFSSIGIVGVLSS